MNPTFHKLKIKDVRTETADSVSVSFDIPADLIPDYSYISGQYLTLKKVVEGEEIRRSYSLCSAPFEKEWRVAIKAVEGGRFSNFANNSLKIGDELDVMTPSGHFKLDLNPSNAKNYVLFAVGSGITPIISIIKSILKFEPNSTISFFYGNKNFSSIIFREEIEALKNEYMENLSVVHILSRESLGNPIQKGRIDAEKCPKLIETFLKNEAVDEVFVCGPEEMIHSVKDTFVAKGVNPKNIHFELFGTSIPVKKVVVSEEDNVKSNVRVIIDGDALDMALSTNGENILDAAQKAGGDLPFACKGGVCCTCKAKILEGTASMDVNYALEPDEIAAGYILCCQAHPTSEKLVVSFDD